MANRRQYEIAFVGLKPGIHEFNYDIKDKFFTAYGEQDFSNCQAHVKLLLDKHSSFMMLKFEVGGKVDVICDRCGNSLSKDLWDEFNMVVKLVENPEEMNEQEEDPDVYYISRTESHLHISDWIYEFVSLTVPLQKMCSEEEMGGPQCNKEVLAMLKKLNAQDNQTVNPVWKGLEKFKDKEK